MGPQREKVKWTKRRYVVEKSFEFGFILLLSYRGIGLSEKKSLIPLDLYAFFVLSILHYHLHYPLLRWCLLNRDCQ